MTFSNLKALDRGVTAGDDQLVETGAPPGTDLRRNIRKTIETVCKTVVLWNQTGATSANVNYETGMAEALGKEIVLVIPTGERPAISADLTHNQVIELS